MIAATPDPERLVCLAARGDYTKVPPWELPFDELMKPVRPGNTTEARMRNLLAKLMDAGHWGPFEHPNITLGFSGMSRVTLAQLTRHRLATYDIQSARAVDLRGLTVRELVSPPSFSAERAKTRHKGEKPITMAKEERERLAAKVWSAELSGYRKLVKGGVPAEDARYLLPMSVPVHGTMTLNARSLMHVIAIRTFGDAQWEIRRLARDMLRVGKEWMPFTFDHFENRILKPRGRSLLAP